MKQDLEKYLAEQRFLLDVEQPDEQLLWEGIRTGIGRQRRFTMNQFWKVAAIFLFGLLITYVVINNSQGNYRYKSLADVSPELGRQEAELRQQADQKWNEVKPMLINGNSQYQFLLDELKELDKIQKVYLSDLNELGANEEIIRVLLDYHEKKLKILDRLLLEIQKQKNHEKQI
jgi:hypothetical protein